MPTIDDVFDAHVVDGRIREETPAEARHAIVLYTAQGMIDNGGIESFVLAGPALERLEEVPAAYAWAGLDELGRKIVEAVRVLDQLGRAEDDIDVPRAGQTLGELNREAWEASAGVYASVHSSFPVA